MIVMKKRIHFILIIPILFSCGSDSEKKNGRSSNDIGDKEKPLYVWMADSEMKRNPDPRLLDFRPKPKWEYTNGLICTAFLKVWENTKEERFIN